MGAWQSFSNVDSLLCPPCGRYQHNSIHTHSSWLASFPSPVHLCPVSAALGMGSHSSCWFGFGKSCSCQAAVPLSLSRASVCCTVSRSECVGIVPSPLVRVRAVMDAFSPVPLCPRGMCGSCETMHPLTTAPTHRALGLVRSWVSVGLCAFLTMSCVACHLWPV